MKKTLAILMVLAMTGCMLTSCGKAVDQPAETKAESADASKDNAETNVETNAETNAETNEETAETDNRRDVGGLSVPLCEEKQELTVWFSPYAGTVMKDLNEIEGVKKMEEITNVHINWIPVNQDEAPEKFGTLMSSETLPDIIFYTAYPGGEEAGIDDGVIYPDMDTLIREHMPNYMNLISSSLQAKREATADNGKMLVARCIVGQDRTAESEGTFSGAAYRADLLEKLGLDVPATIDEWHDALVAAKEAGIPYPFVLNNDGGSSLSNAFGVASLMNTEFLQLSGDEIICGQATQNWKDYLDTMKQWYSEGLINPNFTSFHFYLDTPSAVENNDTLLFSLILSAFTGNNYSNFHMIENSEAYLQPIVFPSAYADSTTIDAGERKIAKDAIFVTTSCKNPELAAEWLDFQYSEEGQYLNWYGIENETYIMGDDGTPQYTDLVLNNPDGLPSTDVLQRYALNQGSSYLGKHDVSASWKLSAATSGESNYELEAVDIWSSPTTNVTISQSLTLSLDEGNIQTKFTDINTMIDEYAINYIIGNPVDDFDKYVETLYEYGLQDVLDTYQEAYDRYLNR